MILQQVSTMLLLGTAATAQAMSQNPDPKSPESIGWWVITFVAVVVGANQVLNFYKSHIKTNPDPRDSYVTVGRGKEILELLEKLAKDHDDSRKYQAIARSKMHRRQNSMENALFYMAGKAEAAGDVATANVIKDQLNRGQAERDAD